MQREHTQVYRECKWPCVCVCVCEAFLSEAHRTLISDSCFAQGACVSVCLWIRSVSARLIYVCVCERRCVCLFVLRVHVFLWGEFALVHSYPFNFLSLSPFCHILCLWAFFPPCLHSSP